MCQMGIKIFLMSNVYKEILDDKWDQKNFGVKWV